MTPIPKGRDSNNVGNNRPILVLPIFNKKIEKVVYKQSTLIENGAMPPNENKSLASAILDLGEQMQKMEQILWDICQK